MSIDVCTVRRRRGDGADAARPLPESKPTAAHAIANFDLEPGFAARLTAGRQGLQWCDLDGRRDADPILRSQLSLLPRGGGRYRRPGSLRRQARAGLRALCRLVGCLGARRDDRDRRAKQLTPAQYLDWCHRRIYARPWHHRQRQGALSGQGRWASTPRAGGCRQYGGDAQCLARQRDVGGEAGLAATPAYVIDGVAIVGHPGLKALQAWSARCVPAARSCAERWLRRPRRP